MDEISTARGPCGAAASQDTGPPGAALPQSSRSPGGAAWKGLSEDLQGPSLIHFVWVEFIKNNLAFVKLLTSCRERKRVSF